MTQNTKQKKDQDALLKLGLDYINKLNKQNALKAVKCFEAIPKKDFPDVYKPMASSVYTNLGWFLIVDKNYKQAEIYLNRAIEFGDYRVPIKLGHIKYLQNNLKEAVDFYRQSSQQLGFIEEIIMEIQDDFSYLKVSHKNIENLTDFLSQVTRDKTTNINQLIKEPDESTPELTTVQGYWKYSKPENALLFSSARIKISFYENQKVVEDYDQIKKHYANKKEAIETLVSKIMIYENKKLLQKIITKAKPEEPKRVWQNWSLYNVVEEQDFEKNFGYENSNAEIKVNVNENDLDVTFTQSH